VACTEFLGVTNTVHRTQHQCGVHVCSLVPSNQEGFYRYCNPAYPSVHSSVSRHLLTPLLKHMQHAATGAKQTHAVSESGDCSTAV
jgi:hypothetical protein